jgi:hypothetical protein
VSVVALRKTEDRLKRISATLLRDVRTYLILLTIACLVGLCVFVFMFMMCCVVMCFVVICFVVMCCDMLCFVVICCDVLCCNVLYCIVLYQLYQLCQWLWCSVNVRANWSLRPRKVLRLPK